MIGEAFELIRNMVKLSRADHKLLATAKKGWVTELERRGSRPQTARLPL